jgi:hypothetical protein
MSKALLSALNRALIDLEFSALNGALNRTVSAAALPLLRLYYRALIEGASIEGALIDL